MSKTKKILIGMLAICLVAALAIGGTLSFLTDTAQKTNVFTIGDDIEIDLDEPGWTPEDGEDLFPGDSMTKDPTVIGLEGESYARLVVSFIDKNVQIANPLYDPSDSTSTELEFIANPNYGKVITDTARIALILQTIYNDPAGTNITAGTMYTLAEVAAYLGFNDTDDFTLDTDYGSASQLYYNYTKGNGKLTEGESATLFTHIVIPSDWTSTQMQLLGDFEIDVIAQAIQTTGFTDADEAYAALEAQLNP